MANKQTAMQELIQWLKIGWKDEDVDTVIKKAEQLLEMEKDQLIDFGRHGFTQGTIFGMSPIVYKPINSEQYYNETYGQ